MIHARRKIFGRTPVKPSSSSTAAMINNIPTTIVWGSKNFKLFVSVIEKQWELFYLKDIGFLFPFTTNQILRIKKYLAIQLVEIA